MNRKKQLKKNTPRESTGIKEPLSHTLKKFIKTLYCETILYTLTHVHTHTHTYVHACTQDLVKTSAGPVPAVSVSMSSYGVSSVGFEDITFFGSSFPSDFYTLSESFLGGVP